MLKFALADEHGRDLYLGEGGGGIVHHVVSCHNLTRVIFNRIKVNEAFCSSYAKKMKQGNECNI